MKQAIGYVALVVRDYDEAIRFFVGKLGPDDEARLKAFAADPVIGKMRQAYARTSGRVLEFVGREIASGGVEQASVIADRAVARFQASRR